MLSASNWISLSQTIALLLTIIVMLLTSRRQALDARREIDELRTNIRNASHQEMFSKIFDIYRLYIEYPKELCRLQSEADVEQDIDRVRVEFMAFAILDLLYLMHLQRDSLDTDFMSETWAVWAAKVLKNQPLRTVYESVKNEYPESFRTAIESVI